MACKKIVNGNKVLCVSFGVYPSYVAGILNYVKQINFFLLQSEELNYADCVEKSIIIKERTFKLPTDYSLKIFTEHHFQLTFGGTSNNKFHRNQSDWIV